LPAYVQRINNGVCGKIVSGQQFKLAIRRNTYPRLITATQILWILSATPCWATTVIALIEGKQNRIVLTADSMAVGVVEKESMLGVRPTDEDLRDISSAWMRFCH
jgi:hypothetical protein